MHGNQMTVLIQNPGTNTAQLLHVRARAEDEAEVNAQRPDVRSRLAGHGEGEHVALLVIMIDFGVVDGTDTQLTLHRSDDGRALEERARERVQALLDLGLR